jgi:hypothetical protein
LHISGALLAFLAPCLIDADVPHGRGGCCEKVAAVTVPALGSLSHKPQVGLVNQRGGIERLARPIVCDLLRRQLA